LQTNLSTSRCDLVPVTQADAAALHALWTSPGVRRYLWDGEIISRERTDEAISASEELFDRRDFGLWLLRERFDHSLVGFAGLWPFREPEEFELLYGISEAMWGHGYAVEASQAVIDYCFTQLGMPVIHASTDVDNGASVRVLEKLGFVQTRRQTVNRLDTIFFEKPR
jgi:[ribosomal protein S5]-alanine N-acetyltransferase